MPMLHGNSTSNYRQRFAKHLIARILQFAGPFQDGSRSAPSVVGPVTPFNQRKPVQTRVFVFGQFTRKSSHNVASPLLRSRFVGLDHAQCSTRRGRRERSGRACHRTAFPQIGRSVPVRTFPFLASSSPLPSGMSRIAQWLLPPKQVAGGLRNFLGITGCRLCASCEGLFSCYSVAVAAAIGALFRG